uniref:Uncharacterized protein n=1 Tax=Nelumbo nucifera TaxID=4432 RepID=A0A822ZGZ5_NELNU|nr:TPA_asm: hypothetical protein HUJ06_000526 [Nelumbo nucifera]
MYLIEFKNFVVQDLQIDKQVVIWWMTEISRVPCRLKHHIRETRSSTSISFRLVMRFANSTTNGLAK